LAVTVAEQNVDTSRHWINPKQPKVFGVIFRLREVGRIFPKKIENFKLWKRPKLLNFRFPEG